MAIAAKTETPHPKLPGTIHSAAAEIEPAGGKALPLAVDVRDEGRVKKAIDPTAAHFGGLDIVVNNASAIQLSPVEQTDMRRFDLMQQINTRGTFMVCKHAIPHLLKADNPHILMLSPPLDMQEKWFAPHTGYSMAKYGMSLVVLGLAGELRGKVAVNALWPRTTIATSAIQNLLGGDALCACRARRRSSPTPPTHLRQAETLHRQFPDRRYVPCRRRRDRFRPVSRRSDAAAADGLLRAGRHAAAQGTRSAGRAAPTCEGIRTSLRTTLLSACDADTRR